MKLTLNSIKRFDKKTDGTPLVTKDNRPYVRLVIGANEYSKPLSGFDNEMTKSWQVGQEVEVEVEQKGEYLNFKVPKTGNNAEVVKKLDEILGYVTKFNLMLVELVEEKRKNDKPKIGSTDMDYPTAEDEGINFDGEIGF